MRPPSDTLLKPLDEGSQLYQSWPRNVRGKMTDPVPYDAFADIYDAWAESAPITRENQEFYVKCLVEADGPAVELGVGNGRIGCNSHTDTDHCQLRIGTTLSRVVTSAL